MAFVSVTRLRLRSWRFLPGFVLRTAASRRQAEAAEGNRGVRVRKTRGLAFWTLTVWRDAEAMRAYRGAGAHAKAMKHLARWCDEASVAHWEGGGTEFPSWEEAARRLRESGRLSPVDRPSPAQAAGRLEIS